MTQTVQPGDGVVYVSAATPLADQAVCTCGWEGRRRALCPTIAVTDALIHACRTGCQPAYPLVWPIRIPTTERPWSAARSTPNLPCAQPLTR